MQGTRSFIDFWLRSQVTEGDHSFDFLNKFFNNNFQDTFTFLLLLNLGVTFFRAIFYVACA